MTKTIKLEDKTNIDLSKIQKDLKLVNKDAVIEKLIALYNQKKGK